MRAYGIAQNAWVVRILFYPSAHRTHMASPGPAAAPAGASSRRSIGKIRLVDTYTEYMLQPGFAARGGTFLPYMSCRCYPPTISLLSLAVRLTSLRRSCRGCNGEDQETGV
jgi:hypothetical protein